MRVGRWLLCGLIGWGLVWGVASFWGGVKAQDLGVEPPKLVELSQNTEKLTDKASLAYREGRLTEAIALWQTALKGYQQAGQVGEQVRVWNNLAMTYGLLGQWPQAEEAIAQSLNLIPNPTRSEEQSLRGETYNVQGIMALNRGQARTALESWQKAEQLYQLAQNTTGVFRSRINQAQALQALGLFPRACQQLLDHLQIPLRRCERIDLDVVAIALDQEPVPLTGDRQQAWITFAKALRQVGQIDASDYVLESLLVLPSQVNHKGEIWLGLAETSEISQDFARALADFQQAMTFPLRPEQRAEIALAQLGIWIGQEQWEEVKVHLPQLWQDISQLLPNRTAIYAQINLTTQILALERSHPDDLPLPTSDELSERLQSARRQAQSLGDRSGESYAVGTLGELYRQQKQWAIAETLTQQALALAEPLSSPELVYQWQWQLARLKADQGNSQGAIADYLAAIATLKPITGDLAANPEIQFSFQKQVEPLYRELLSLLLPQNNQESVDPANLEQAKEQIESLQLVELNNFFREICLTSQAQSLETIDPQAAIIYPIILSDRLALLFSLPGKPLQVKISPVPRNILESKIEELRRTIVIRSRRDYLLPAQQLYEWLIRPLGEELQQQTSLKTLVFVLDGALRNIPFAALYDRKKQAYLIESYQVALTPGLTLLAPQPIQQTNLHTLLAGLSQSPRGLAPLQYVEAEFKSIQALVPSRLLLNQNFTKAKLRQALSDSTFPIVHLATHGQFSSRYDDTFILTWDTRLNINDLEAILQTNELQNEGVIELLVLSACETAVGDRRAALGLAGIAVRSGARSTLATLWSVNDEGASTLIRQFYEQLVQKRVTKAESLRQAQLALLKNRWYRHPFYWSPFVLVGNWL